MEDDEEEAVIGWHYGKKDIDRVGFFDDTVGDSGPYEPIRPDQLRSGMLKNKPQMSCNKTTGYFEPRFVRIFAGECLPGMGRSAKKKPDKRSLLQETKKIVPPGYTKWHSTPGDAFGCFSKHPRRFDPQERLKEPAHELGKAPHNMKTNPGPRGGPGYSAITLTPYIATTIGPEPYDPDRGPVQIFDSRNRFFYTFWPKPYFEENPYKPLDEVYIPPEPKPKKKPSKRKSTFHLHFPDGGKNPGKNNGCLSKYPQWMPDPGRPKPRSKNTALGPFWQPGTVPVTRTKYTTSIIDKVTNTSCNVTNYATYRPKVYTLY